MQKVDLSNFLELTNVGTIILPIGEHKFELSQQAAEDIVIALQGAVRLLTQRALDGSRCTCEKPLYRRRGYRFLCVHCKKPPRQ